MINTIRNYSKVIIIIVCVAMVVTGAMMGYGFMGGGFSSGDIVQSANIAVVNGNNISQEHYYSILRNYVAGMEDIPRAQEVPLKLDVLNLVIERELIMEIADDSNFRSQISDEDVDEVIVEILEENQMTEDELLNLLEMTNRTMTQFRTEIKRDLDQNNIIEQVLEEKVFKNIVVSEEEIINSYEQIHPQLIVQRFADDKDHAEEKINDINQELLDGVKFLDLAEEHSDMPNVDLGKISRDNNRLPADVTELAFGLDKGLSEIIEGEDAFYIFNILEKRVAVGEDYEDSKEEIEKNIRREKEMLALSDWLEELKSNSNIQINDPVLSGFKALQSGDINIAIEELETALERNPAAMTYVYLAEAYNADYQLDKAQEIYERAIEDYSFDWELHYQYAEFMMELDNADKAISLLDRASELAGPNIMAQYQIYMGFAMMGAEEKAEAIMEKISDYQEQMQIQEEAIEDTSAIDEAIGEVEIGEIEFAPEN
ncbi:SurA N-terminal domain-containing protein [Natronospora cellulosivora (SeqCode)]